MRFARNSIAVRAVALAALALAACTTLPSAWFGDDGGVDGGRDEDATVDGGTVTTSLEGGAPDGSADAAGDGGDAGADGGDGGVLGCEGRATPGISLLATEGARIAWIGPSCGVGAQPVLHALPISAVSAGGGVCGLATHLEFAVTGAAVALVAVDDAFVGVTDGGREFILDRSNVFSTKSLGINGPFVPAGGTATGPVATRAFGLYTAGGEGFLRTAGGATVSCGGLGPHRAVVPRGAAFAYVREVATGPRLVGCGAAVDTSIDVPPGTYTGAVGLAFGDVLRQSGGEIYALQGDVPKDTGLTADWLTPIAGEAEGALIGSRLGGARYVRVDGSASYLSPLPAATAIAGARVGATLVVAAASTCNDGTILAAIRAPRP